MDPNQIKHNEKLTGKRRLLAALLSQSRSFLGKVGHQTFQQRFTANMLFLALPFTTVNMIRRAASLEPHLSLSQWVVFTLFNLFSSLIGCLLVTSLRQAHQAWKEQKSWANKRRIIRPLSENSTSFNPQIPSSSPAP